jgi:multiple antibiotic resistance protein
MKAAPKGAYMAGDILTFTLLVFSSLIIIVNPLAATLIFVSLTANMDQAAKTRTAKDASRYALIILIVFAILGGVILELFGITLEAFRIAGGILLFLIGMEMVYARTSRTKLTDTEKYEGIEAEDVAITPLALPMIAGPGAITTTIVLISEAGGNLGQDIIVIVAIFFAIALTYLAMRNADIIVKKIGQKEFRAINRIMGILLLAIAVQFVIAGLITAFPVLSGGTVP